jgi:hypothetical protein
MKTVKITLFSICLILISAITNSAKAQSKFDAWPQLKEFHQVMSQTFHPVEEGNFEPIKSRVGEMVEKANALKSNPIPSEFNKKEVVKAVAKLQKDSKKLQKLIAAGGTDEDIKKSLSSLHDVFHQIVGLCSEEDKH